MQTKKIVVVIGVMMAAGTLFAGAGKPPLVPISSPPHSGKKALSDKEIDRIFISFLKEQEEAAKEKARQKKTASNMPDAGGSPSGRSVSPGMTLEEVQRQKEILSNGGVLPPQSLPGVVVPAPQGAGGSGAAAPIYGFTVFGVSCIAHGGCNAFTTDGIKKPGDKLSTGETIKKITMRKIVTNLREIKF